MSNHLQNLKPEVTRDRATIVVGHEGLGCLVALGMLMSEDWEICFLAESNEIRRRIEQMFSKPNASILVRPSFRDRLKPRERIFESAVQAEKSFNTRLALLLSQDRALGQAYLTNVPNYPLVRRALWSDKEKIESLLVQLEFYQGLANSTDLVLSIHANPLMNCVLDTQGVSHYHLSHVKFGKRFFWSDDNYQGSRSYKNLLATSLSTITDDLDLPESYELDALGKKRNEEAVSGVSSALRKIVWIVKSDLWKYLSGKKKANSYRMFAWAPVVIRGLRHKNLVKSMGMRPWDLTERRVVFFPLHMEPEVSLLHLSPEFTNVMELVTSVSKALPADCLLVVKEQANAFGLRGSKFYFDLDRYPNVRLAHPDHRSDQWLERACLVATITGTVGIEAIYYRRPLLSFGAHQIVNDLPTVRYVKGYQDVADAVCEFLTKPVPESEFQRALSVLYSVQNEVSFELEEFSDKLRDDVPQMEDAARALAALKAELVAARVRL